MVPLDGLTHCCMPSQVQRVGYAALVQAISQLSVSAVQQAMGQVTHLVVVVVVVVVVVGWW